MPKSKSKKSRKVSSSKVSRSAGLNRELSPFMSTVTLLFLSFVALMVVVWAYNNGLVSFSLS